MTALWTATGMSSDRMLTMIICGGIFFSIAGVATANDWGVFRGVTPTDILPRLIVILVVSWAIPIYVGTVVWPEPQVEPMDRGYPHVAAIMVHTEIGDSYAEVTMVNIGRYRIIPPVLIRGAVIGSPPLVGPDEETKHLFSGQEKGHNGGLITFPGNYWDPGDAKSVTVKTDWPFSFKEWREISDCNIRDCKRIIYVVTKTYGQDKFGAFSPKESCWYVSAIDWDHAKKCFGHND